MNDYRKRDLYFKLVIYSLLIICVIIAIVFSNIQKTKAQIKEANTKEIIDLTDEMRGTNIDVVNPDQGVEILSNDNGIVVSKDIKKDKSVETSTYEKTLKDCLISTPQIARVFYYNWQPKNCVRDLNYEIMYDEFISELCNYKEDGIVRYKVVPEAAITIDYGQEVHISGSQIYTDPYVTKWAFQSYYMQTLFSLYPGIEKDAENFGRADDPILKLATYLKEGEYPSEWEDSELQYGLYLNLEEQTVRVKVRYNILDTFTGECFYSEYSEVQAIGKEAEPFDIDKLMPIEFDNDFKLSTAEVRYATDYMTGELYPYLSFKLKDYEKELDKAMYEIGDVIVVLEVFDANGITIDTITYDLAYLDDGYFEYYIDWYIANGGQVDLDNIECRVKLAYVYDILDTEASEYPSETSWLYVICK